jgi:tripartite-type tricarboxylate transporter receptor subunit TctC
MHRTVSTLARGLAFIVAGTFAWSAAAQTAPYPTKPIRIIVGFAAGGAPDALARIVGEKLTARWGQSVVVENRLGAQGNIAMAAVAKADPDGYTLALMPVGNAAVNPALFPKLGYDPLKDFAPIAELASVENVLVVPASSPNRTLTELVERGRKADPVLTYASPGIGSMAHLGAELLARSSGFRMTHVPYRGVAPALTDVVRGDVDMMLAQLSTAKPLIEGGQLRALGLAGEKRSTVMPDLPTIAEALKLPGFEATSWYALLAPALTPPAIITALNAAVGQALREPDVVSALQAQGATPIGGSPEALRALIVADGARWSKLIAEAGIKAE